MRSAELSLEAGFYVTGGTLRRDAACYVERQADTELYEGLKQGQFCYVLTARQMGKSSLMVRTAARLREEGIGVAVLDLTGIGQNLSAEQWYGGLLSQMGQQLDIEDELDNFWQDETRFGPLRRWLQAISKVILRRRANRVVVFIDEIDSVRSLPFSTDEFFAGIREFYNRRSEEPELERLTFCLLGVATPSDVIRDTRTTPFNIGQRIELHDFAEAEAAPLAKGLRREENLATRLLGRVLYWSGGHPYLTQRLCQAVADDATVKAPEGVDRICAELFFSRRAQERDDNLLFVRERMLRSEVDLAGLLSLYAQVHQKKRVRDDETNPLVSILRLSGITRVEDGSLRARNRIYARVFDREWMAQNMPDAELRRQRAAYRRGLLRATAVAGVVLSVIASLTFVAIKQRNLAQDEAARADHNLRQANLSAKEAQQALTEAERQRQRAEEQKTEAELQQQRAEEQRAEAEWQRQQAFEQQKIVEQQRSEAQQQRERANLNEVAYQKLMTEFNRQRPSRYASGFEIGITFWRLRTLGYTSEGKTPPPTKSPLVAGMVAERISANAPLSTRDRVRFTIEVSRQGYLYVFDREQYADGTFSVPHLIFPRRYGDNRVSPGMLIGIPNRVAATPFFEPVSRRPDHVADEISVLVTSEPVPGLQIETVILQGISREQFDLWKQWETVTDRFEAVDLIGRLYTEAESEAEDARPGDTRRLKQGDPLPHVLYRSTAPHSDRIMVTIPLRIRK
jgi:AAA-like domain